MIGTPDKSPAIASPKYNAFVWQFGLEMLKEGGDLQIVDGDLAMTKDLDLMLGDKAYGALFRLAEHWRHNAPHVLFLFELLDSMVTRQREATDRLEMASQDDARRRQATRQFHYQSEEFLDAWHKHFDEEGAAVSGQITYAGCILMLASNALLRFKDDLDCPNDIWMQCGPRCGGHSIGEVVIASANGFRHGDEWAKTRPLKPIQLKSVSVLSAALGARKFDAVSVPGRCAEVIHLLSGGKGYEGFCLAILQFAHEVAGKCRRLNRAKP